MEQKTYLSNNSSKCMKGIFAIFVLGHHLYQYSGFFHGSYIGGVFQAMGYLSVGIFFFFAGYGLMFSYSKKKNYIDSFFKKRFTPLYVFYVVLIILYTLYSVLLGNAFSRMLFIKSFLFGGTYVSLGWYLQVTFFIYILFYLIFKFFKNSAIQVVVFVVSLAVYCIICFSTGLPSTWYESIFCVTLGMIWSLVKDKIDFILQRKALVVMVGSGILFVICLVGSYVFPLGIIFKVFSSLFFSIMTITLAFLLQNTSFIYSKLTIFLGNYSLEIYTSQGFLLALRKGVNFHLDNAFLFVIIAICGTIVISYFMKMIYLIIIRILFAQQ